MAHPSEKQKQIADLIRRAEESRKALGDAHARLTHALDLPSRLKSSVSGSPGKWLGGSLVAGLATSLLFRRGKRRESGFETKEKSQRGHLTGLVMALYAVSKPALKAYGLKLLKDYVAERLASRGHRARPY